MRTIESVLFFVFLSITLSAAPYWPTVIDPTSAEWNLAHIKSVGLLRTGNIPDPNNPGYASAGTGSGVQISRHLVLTAAHVVTDYNGIAHSEMIWQRQCSNPVPNSYPFRWIFLQMPNPALSRTVNVFMGDTGYAALVKDDGQNAEEAFNVDIATLVFYEDLGENFAQYLVGQEAIDAIVSSNQKFSIGYPAGLYYPINSSYPDAKGFPSKYEYSMHKVGGGDISLINTASHPTYFRHSANSVNQMVSGHGNSGGPLVIQVSPGVWKVAAIVVSAERDYLVSGAPAEGWRSNFRFFDTDEIYAGKIGFSLLSSAAYSELIQDREDGQSAASAIPLHYDFATPSIRFVDGYISVSFDGQFTDAASRYFGIIEPDGFIGKPVGLDMLGAYARDVLESRIEKNLLAPDDVTLYFFASKTENPIDGFGFRKCILNVPSLILDSGVCGSSNDSTGAFSAKSFFTQGGSIRFRIKWHGFRDQVPSNAYCVVDGIRTSMTISVSTTPRVDDFLYTHGEAEVSMAVGEVGLHNFYFEVDMQGQTYRFPESASTSMTLGVYANQAGWDAQASSVTLGNSRLKPNNGTTIKGSAYNKSEAGKTYAALQWSLKVFNSSGTVVWSKAGNMPEMTSTASNDTTSYAIPGTAFASEGTYTAEFRVEPDKDSDLTNNAVAQTIWVTSQPQVQQYLVIPANLNVQAFLNASFSAGGANYLVKGFTTKNGLPKTVKFGKSGTTSADFDLVPGQFKLVESGKGVIFCEGLGFTNATTYYCDTSIGSQEPNNIVVYDAETVAGVAGETITFAGNIVSGQSYTFASGSPSIYAPDGNPATVSPVASWSWGSVNRSNSNKTGKWAVTIPSGISIGTYSFYFGAKLSTSGSEAKFIRKLNIVVAPPPPAISASSVSAVVVGKDVSITGTGFGSSGKLYIGGIEIATKSWSDTTIVFTAPSLSGETQTIQVVSTNGSSNTLNIEILQKGLLELRNSADDILSPESLDWSTIELGESVSKTVKLTNTGLVAVSLSSIVTSGTDATAFSYRLRNAANTADLIPPYSLSADASVLLEISFNPQSVGAKVAAINVQTDAAERPTGFATIALAGSSSDTTGPTISLRSPALATSTTLSSTITVGVACADPSGMKSVVVRSSSGVDYPCTSSDEFTWTSGSLPLQIGGNTFTLTATDNGNVSAQRSLTISRLQSHTLALAVVPAAGGSIESSESGSIFADGSRVWLRAVPNAGYDFAGWSGASTSLDATIEISMSGDLSLTANFLERITEPTAPTVTINQASEQEDPTSASQINFTAVFSDTVTELTDTDVIIEGSAGATTASVVGSGNTYNVAVSGMTQSGTVTVRIPANAAQDTAGGWNLASTSTDSTVTYNKPQKSDQAAPTINSAASFTFGSSYTATTTGTGFGAVEWALGTGSTAAGAAIDASTGAVTATGVGTVKVKARYAGDANHEASPYTADFTVTINKAPLTAKADDKSKVQGAENPTLTISYSGFVNGDTESAITAPTASTTATTSSEAGPYPITLTGGSGANYNLTLQAGTLTVNAAGALPTVTTSSVSQITAMSAQLGGSVESDGGAAVTARGYLLSSVPGAMVDTVTPIAVGSELGSFARIHSGLSPATVYYVRAYATNAAGTAYGLDVQFETLATAPNAISDSFDTALDTTSRWEVVGGTWATSGGKLTGFWSQGAAYSDHGKLLLRERNLDDDFDATFVAILNTGAGHGFSLYNSAGNLYNVNIANSGVYVEKRVSTPNGNPYVGVGGADYPVSAITPTTAKLSRRGAVFSVYINGGKVYEFTDTHWNGRLRLGLKTYGTSVFDSFDYVPLGDGAQALIGHWKFDGDVLDSGPNGLNGINSGGTFVADRNGVENAAIRFRGRNIIAQGGGGPVFTEGDSVRVPKSDVLALGSTFTIAFWTRPLTETTSGTLDDMVLIAQHSPPSNTQGTWIVELGLGSNSLGFGGSPYFDLTGGTGVTMQTGVWAHGCVTYADGSLKWYVNGVLVNEVQRAYQEMLPLYDLIFGAFQHPGSPSGLYGFYDGDLDDVLIYARALTASEVTAIGTSNQAASLSVDSNPEVAGLVTGGGEFPIGSVQTITAVANDGYIFSGWSDGGLENPRQVTVLAGGVSYTANFTVVQNRILTLDGSLDFGDRAVGATPSLPLTIFNDGNASLTVSGITFPTGFSGNWTAGVITAGNFQQVNVTFSPTTAQSYGGTITVASDKTGGIDTIAVAGVGVDNRTMPTITWAHPVNIVYGVALSGTQLNADASGVPGTFAYSPEIGSVLAAGDQILSVTFTPMDAVNYTQANKTVQLTVNKATLVATADDKTKVQGSTNPSLTITYAGFVNGETKTAITEPTISTSATTGSAAGIYPITLAGGSAINYALSLQDGTLTVTSSGESFAIRTLPAFYSPGLDVTVSIVLTPPTGTQVYAVQDSIPAGWAFKSSASGGAYDLTNNLVKFGPYFDNTIRTLTYVVAPPANAAGEVGFAGTASIDGADSSIGGTAVLTRVALHPADLNPADGQIQIGEVTAYGAAWKRGDVWTVEPATIPISYVTRVGFLWKGGESYHYDSAIASAPLWWVNGAMPSALPAGLWASPAPMALESEATLSTGVRSIIGSTISVAVTPDTLVQVYAVEDLIPAGLTVSDITQSGSFDAINRKVKWGPFFDNTTRTLAYQVSGPDGAYVLGGVVSIDGTDQVITGDTELLLGATSDFAGWQATSFTALELDDSLVSGPNADPDGDGLPNLVEYALGLDPKDVNSAGLPEASTTATDWVYTYNRPADRTDLTYEVEVSTDLTTWTTAGVTHARIAEGATEKWQATYPISLGANVFFRLKVTQL